MKIKDIRTAQGLTQNDLAKKAGVSRNLIAKLESGTAKNTTIATLAKLAAALQVNVGDIFFTDTV